MLHSYWCSIQGYETADTKKLLNRLRRIQPAGSAARYENRVGDNHHHLICRACGGMIDVDCAVGYTPCLTASDAAGFDIDEAEVIFWGTCPDCRVDDLTPTSTPQHHS